MLKESLKSLFTRDLNRLKTEIGQYTKEENIWRIEKDIANSAGSSVAFMLIHLSTHLTYHLGQINYHRRMLDI